MKTIKVEELNQGGNMKTIKIKELGIEVEAKIHDKNKPLSKVKIPKGWRLLRMNEIIFLHNNLKYRKILNFKDTREFLEESFKFNKNKEYVAWFGDGVGLLCGGDAQDGDSVLGVRFCRDVEK